MKANKSSAARGSHLIIPRTQEMAHVTLCPGATQARQPGGDAKPRLRRNCPADTQFKCLADAGALIK